MLLEALIAARDLGRLHEIAWVLGRHGFGDLVQRTGLAKFLSRAGRVLRWEATEKLSSPISMPERARRALEELGPTFVKLGQVLASRSDLMPPEWIEEFSRLHDKVKPVAFAELLPQLEEDLNAKPDEVFEDLCVEPLAAGSIAQVHRARLASRDVVLKVRRPGIQEKVAADLRLLYRLSELLEDEIVELRRFRPRKIVRQFARTMKSELDMVIEAKNLRAIAENMEGVSGLVTPEVFSEYTRERLLVLSFLDGLPASEWIQGKRPEGMDAKSLAGLGADIVLKMVFADGLFHADPHPGNVLFLPSGRIGLLDFGMVGRLTEERRRELVTLLGAVGERNEAGVVETLLDWSDVANTDVELFTQDARAFLDRYHGVALVNLDVTGMLVDIAEMVRENNLVLPADVAMLIKVFVTLEGLGRALDPEFEIAAHIEPAATEMMRRLHSPRALLRRNIRDLRSILTVLPKDLRALISRARRGGFKIELDLERLDQFGHQIDRSANRVTVGLITAALIVGTAIAMTVESGPKLFGLPALGLLGFVSSVVVGMGLLWSILRSGRG